MSDKRMSIDDVVAQISDGMTVGIGGWGSRRKPMALVRALCRSPVKDLTVVSYGGPDVGLLCASKKIRKLVFGFVTMDSIPLEPHFRAARQNGELEVMEIDEGMFQWGLYAAANRLPFMPTRAGLGSDVLTTNPSLKTIASPYDGTEVVAMPPLKLDVALVHMNRADGQGNAQYLGPDVYFDDLFCMAADKAFVSSERIVATEDFAKEGSVHTLRISRLFTDGVVETPRGAHFTSCVPDYDRDEPFQTAYAKAAASDETWAEFRATYLDVTEDEYQRATS
jgi:acyl CoA:acetate/3-ketoacid CoA transferase alpha subunit